MLENLPSLLSLNLNRSMLSDDGCENFARLTNLESLNLDSCRICDEGLANLTGEFNSQISGEAVISY
ncbi:hypothetical protein CK203_104236 [Vitis vinifera]|uniref:Uncharacterized protein n=1 Tax=Vitis vinifera TaxID=29760 RepID=A0A438FFY9_VITVI|nr:hypothetical protein CK203_104236 [Vitis vinifera]